MSNFGDIVSNEPKESFYLPPGIVMPFAGTASAPTGWLLCDGSSYGTALYPNLYAAVGNTYGASGTVFNVPDLRRKFVLGFGTAASTTSVGLTGGNWDHTHSGPSHAHTYDHYHDMDHVHGMTHTHSSTFPQTDINTSIDGNYTNPNADRYALEDVGIMGVPNTVYLVKSLNHHSAFNHYHPVRLPQQELSTNSMDTSTTGGVSSSFGATKSSGPKSGGNSSTSTNNAGTGQTGTANPPYMTLQYIIKY